MPLPWIKMWLEALDDSKLTRLSLAERGAWWGLLKLAGKCEADGKIISGGEGLSLDEIAEALHIKPGEDRQALESMIAKMEKRGSLRWNEGVLFVIHYEERQRIPPSAQRVAVAERVRQHRDRERQKRDEGVFIFGQSIEKAKRIAVGEYLDIPESKRDLYRKELKRRGIPF